MTTHEPTRNPNAYSLEYPATIIVPRRVWELPLAILLWIYLIAGVIVFLMLLLGGLGAISGVAS